MNFTFDASAVIALLNLAYGPPTIHRPYDVLTTAETEEKMRRAREEDSRRRIQKSAERKARRALKGK